MPTQLDPVLDASGVVAAVAAPALEAGSAPAAGTAAAAGVLPTDLARDLGDLYGGLPPWSMPFFWIALVVVLASGLSLIVLVVRAQIAISRTERVRGRHGATPPGAKESAYLWVFVVPALNEAVTIADSVGRLAQVAVTHKRILVVNDGSDDGTGEILDGLRVEVPELTVLTRVAPNARQGKSEALNDAWRYLTREILAVGGYAGWDPTRVIVAVVDADGRLDPGAAAIAHHFDDERVGGVQALVRIYNRHSPLTWAQDVEFGVFGRVFQMGRKEWGTANMGGNGQFNRLSALNDVALPDSRGNIGPWREGRLTEDQDIGLRMIRAGWRGSQSTSVTIHQQGLNSLRPLYRQRTRWAQGGWQMLDIAPSLLRNRRIGLVARTDQFWYLMTPLIQMYLGFTVVMSAALLASGTTKVQWSPLVLVIIYALSILPSVISVVFARGGFRPLGLILSFLLAHAYVLYTWLIYPVVVHAALRQLAGRTSWAKTKREAIAAPVG
ncbi:MAG: glycosyltransferase family 2 protein [Leucobacter sp.]